MPTLSFRQEELHVNGIATNQYRVVCLDRILQVTQRSIRVDLYGENTLRTINDHTEQSNLSHLFLSVMMLEWQNCRTITGFFTPEDSRRKRL